MSFQSRDQQQLQQPKVFGQTSSSRYQRQFGNYRGNGRRHGTTSKYGGEDDRDEEGATSKATLAAQMRRAKLIKGNALDRDVMRVEEFMPSSSTTTSFSNQSSDRDSNKKNRRGWLYNILATTVRLYSVFSILVLRW